MQPYQGGAPMMGQQAGMGGMPGAMTAGGPPKQFMITLLLALFAGGFGAHRFYTGHILFGVLQFFTLGGCGIWALIDIIMIVTGKYTDAQGAPARRSELSGVTRSANGARADRLVRGCACRRRPALGRCGR